MDFCFTYRDGKFIAGDPLGLNDSDSINKALERHGYSPSQDVGDDAGLCYSLWEHDERGWVVCFDTATGGCTIVVEGWPDLVDLLAKLSVIVLAGTLRDWDDNGKNCPVHLPVRQVGP
jgi:hypothetical protein